MPRRCDSSQPDWTSTTPRNGSNTASTHQKQPPANVMVWIASLIVRSSSCMPVGR